MRALAVVLVLLFHAGFTWLSGGYVGVSVFFTLSGFLITRLLLVEHAGTGTVSFRRFYSRRAKRLLPASMLCVAGVMLARHVGEYERVETLRGDGVAALGQVLNWTRLAGHTSYANLFADPRGATVSPLEHYWSLAIEEQFYLLWPATLVLFLAVARRRRWSIRALLAGATVLFAAAAPVIAHVYGPDAAYWSTPARLAEILVGAWAAAWTVRQRTLDPRLSRLGPVAVVAVLVAAAAWPSGSGPAYQGWLPVLALASAGLVLALQVPGRLQRAFSFGPLVAIGKVSYGLYLFHWPIFVGMRQHGWNLATPGGVAVALGVTGAVATLSYVLAEQPIRHAHWPGGRASSLALLGAGVAALAIVVAPGAIPFVDIDDATLQAASIQPVDSLAPLRPAAATTPPATTTTTSSGTTNSVAATRAPVTSAATTTTAAATTTTTTVFPTVVALPAPPSRPVRVLVIGDSTAAATADGLAAWALDHAEYAQVTLIWAPALGFLADGTVTSFDSSALADHAHHVFTTDVPAKIAELQPDVVMLMTTVQDVANRQWTDDEGPLAPTDDRFRARLLAAYQATVDTIVADGAARVAWVVPPVPTVLWPQAEMRETDRYLAQHDVIHALVEGGDPRVTVVDVARWCEVTGVAANPDARPDGIHFAKDFSRLLAEQYLGPELVDVALGLTP